MALADQQRILTRVLTSPEIREGLRAEGEDLTRDADPRRRGDSCRDEHPSASARALRRGPREQALSRGGPMPSGNPADAGLGLFPRAVPGSCDRDLAHGAGPSS